MTRTLILTAYALVGALLASSAYAANIPPPNTTIPTGDAWRSYWRKVPSKCAPSVRRLPAVLWD